MKQKTAHKHRNVISPYAKSEPKASHRRWERRITWLLWLLAVACLILGALVWWRLLTATL